MYFEGTNGAGDREDWGQYLVATRFDAVTFNTEMTAENLDAASGDQGSLHITLSNTLANGSVRVLVEISQLILKSAANYQRIISAYFHKDGSGTNFTYISSTFLVGANENTQAAGFAIAVDYELNEINFQLTSDHTGLEQGEANIQFPERFSREFNIAVKYEFLDNNAGTDDIYRMQISGFELTRKDILGDIVAGILNPILEGFLILLSPLIFMFQILAGVMLFGFDALGGFLKPLFEAINAALSIGFDALGVLLGALETAIGNVAAGVWGFFSAVLGNILTALGQLAAGIWGLFQTAIDGLVTLLTNIWTAFVAIAGDFIDAVIAWLLTVIDDVIELIANIVFFIWDTAGFPDLLAILEAVLLNFLFPIIAGTPQFIVDLAGWVYLGGQLILLGFWLWALFLAFASQGFEPFESLSEFVERMFRGPDVTFHGYGPFKIPLGVLVFLPLTMFIIVEPTGSIIWIW
jgi:hypothetical protein